MGIVNTQYSNMVSKLTNKGDTMLFVGYSIDHASHVYKMVNFKTNNVIITIDIKWLDIKYLYWKRKTNNDIMTYH